MKGETRVLNGPAEAAEEAARRLVEMMAERPKERFSLALSGGSTPQRLYRLLASLPWRDRIDWKALHIFLADERFLPLDHAESNFRMIRETLINPVNALAPGTLPSSNIHPMPTGGTVEDCADRYEAELREFFGDATHRLDCIILGMGPDGHTASLFPGHVHPVNRWVLPVHDSPKPPPTRLSLSLELINQARNVFFLVTGPDKSEALSTLRNPTDETSLPAGQVKLDEGRLIWLVDEAAWGEKPDMVKFRR